MQTLKEQNDRINQLIDRNENKLKDCLDAYEATSRCLNHSLITSELNQDMEYLALLKDCSEMTNLAANFIREGSIFQEQICTLSAEICTKCADKCHSLEYQDNNVISCINSCRNFAEKHLRYVH